MIEIIPQDWHKLRDDEKGIILLRIETLLNTYSTNRYHFEPENDGKYSVVELQPVFELGLLKPMKIKRIVISNLNIDELAIWLLRHIRVTLIE